jgi:hypothetical protein
MATGNRSDKQPWPDFSLPELNPGFSLDDIARVLEAAGIAALAPGHASGSIAKSMRQGDCASRKSPSTRGALHQSSR